MPHLPDPQLLPEFYAWVPLKRFVAWIIDFTLILLLTMMVLVFTVFLTTPILPIVYVALNIAYRTVTIARWGATPGMAVMAMELVTLDGRRPDRGLALAHTLGFTVSMITVVPQIASVAMMLTSPRGQGLSDLLLGTVMLNRAARA